MTVLAGLSFVIWLWLLTMHGRFWSAGPVLQPQVPARAPAVAIVVPARDEAPFIARTLRSLLDPDYPGDMRVTLVDDRSTDGTGAIAQGLGDARLRVVTGAPRPAGWAGKLWAVSQGVAASGTPEYFFLTDADIEHAPTHLSSLVALAERHDLDMVSEMVDLFCDSLAEKALIPAFVFYFQLLYPFTWVNDSLSKTAAAAGGTVLIRGRALARIGGIETVRGALIDDVALAGAVKAGGRIYLGHSAQARSIRPYPGFADIWRMVARSAYAQLRFSRLMLAGTIFAMALVWLIPPAAALAGHGWTSLLGLAAWAMLTAAYLPTLTRFRRSWWWAMLLPAISLFYLAATIGSAVNHHRGRGVVWKGRAYAEGTP